MIRLFALSFMLSFCVPVILSQTVSGTDTVALSGVEVVGFKQGNNLSSLPVSATSISAAETEKLGIVSVKGLSDVVPNFFVPDYGSRITSSIYVRGLGSRMDQPAVGLNIDNIPILNKDAYDLDIVDIVKMEMLRGPQSTLYGRNTMCGLINITTLNPLQFQGLKARAEYSSGTTWRASIGIYHKFSSKHGISLVGGYNSSNGFFRNDYNNSHVGKENQWNTRINYTFNNDKISIRNTLSLSHLNQSGYPYEYTATGRINYNDTCFYHRFLLSDGVSIGWNHNDIKFSSITSFQYINDNLTLDQDFLPDDYFTLTQKKSEYAFTQDLISKGANGIWKWLFGLFGFYKHTDMHAPVTFKNAGIKHLIEDNRNNANPQYPINWDTRDFILNSDFIIPSFGVALYHQSEISWGDFKIEAGLRLDFERASLKFKNYCSTGYNIYQYNSYDTPEYWRHVNIDINEKGNLHKNFLQLLPKLTFTYQPSSFRNSSLYASIAKGYKAGGYNTQMFSDVLQQKLMGVMGIGASYKIDDVIGYKPEKSWNYEVGTHLNFPDAEIFTDASIFYIDCSDQQLTMFPDGTTTGRIMTNAGRTHSKGGEISVQWLPSSLPLSLHLSYGYTNARFKKFFNGKYNYAGKKIPYAPANTLFFEATYSPINKITLSANLKCAGPIYWNEDNSCKQNFYPLLGANISFELPAGFSLKIWGENLTDARFNTFYFVSMGNEFVQKGKPIRFGATVMYNISKTQ